MSEKNTDADKAQVEKIEVEKAESVKVERIEKVDTININIGVKAEEEETSDEERAHPYANCKADPKKEPLKWLRYWVDQQVWRWLNYRCEKEAGGKWLDIKRDPALKAKYAKQREKIADRAIHDLRRTNKQTFLRWFHNTAFSAPCVGLGEDKPMGPMEREQYSELLDTYWAEACRHGIMVLSAEKSRRNKGTKSNDGLTSNNTPVPHSAEG